MRADDEILIRVQRDWDGWRTAEVRFGDLQNIHWFQPRQAPRPLIHGYVSCASVPTGEIPHDCDPTDAPHWLLVCVLKRHTVPSAYVELVRRADEHRTSLANGCGVLRPCGISAVNKDPADSAIALRTRRNG
jgi:hypothetical protein